MLHNLLTDYDLGRVFIIQSNIQTNLSVFLFCFFSSQFYFAKYHGRLPDILEKMFLEVKAPTQNNLEKRILQ